MKKSFQDIEYPLGMSYREDTVHRPIEFYTSTFPYAKDIDIHLGYFSSNAIIVLSSAFAHFIYNGGKMRLITNHVLSEKDIKLLSDPKIYNERLVQKTIGDLRELKKELKKGGQHFFDCLKYLIREKRLEIVPVITIKGKASHYKNILLKDYFGNKLYTTGSGNFTANGVALNGEDTTVFASWRHEDGKMIIDDAVKRFEKIFKKEHNKYTYLNTEDIEIVIKKEGNSKDESDLLKDGKELLEDLLVNEEDNCIRKADDDLEIIIAEIESTPHFPRFDNKVSSPRPYQEEAYQAWVKNGRKGLFAMATGTGKTITSLNCILNDYKINNYYKFIVLVPTTALAKQWVDESEHKFNFQETIVCCSINNNWKEELKKIGKNVIFKRDSNYSIITTYATFKGLNFQTIIKDYFSNEYEKITLIADEAHTMGSQGFLKVLPNYLQKRIGLSATPERQFDDIGNANLNKYFSVTQEKYTYEYNMKTAIEKKVLCQYYYYPKIVSLEQSEQNEYLKISKKLAKCIDPKTGKYRDSDYVNNLLIQRKNVIHKASRKVNELVSIIHEIGKENFKNAFIYVPEGIEVDYTINDKVIDSVEEETDKLIDQYLAVLYEKHQLRMAKFTGETKNRDQIFEQFKTEKIDALLAMKCLDEGVDIPQTKYAIFCSSTGNPRQYVQRRGRVLRNFKGKESAVIYDLIVKPITDHTNTDEKLSKIEKNIFMSELKRLVNFAVLSNNKDACLKSLENMCYDLNIDIYELANKELENYN